MSAFQVLCATRKQLDALRGTKVPVSRVCLETETVLDEDGCLIPLHRLYDGGQQAPPVYVALPHMTRHGEDMPDIRDLKTVAEGLLQAGYAGVLVRNLEQHGFFALHAQDIPRVADEGLYVWNREAYAVLAGEAEGDGHAEAPASRGVRPEYTLPAECGFAENRRTAQAIGEDVPCAYRVYGRQVMMVSAGCVKQNTGACTGLRGTCTVARVSLTDRTGHVLPVVCRCRNCYNVILNAVPLSLHGQLRRIAADIPQAAPRIDFTTEDAAEAEAVLRFFADCDAGKEGIMPPFAEYTTGRFRKGVE